MSLSLQIIIYLFFGFYLLASSLLFLYGINCYVIIFLFQRKTKKALPAQTEYLKAFWQQHSPNFLPKVTTQLPIFNEKNVARRLILTVANFDYPRDKHEIQVLDDSTDETQAICRQTVAELREKGLQINYIHRDNREGFKAGALKEGLAQAQGDYLAVFDADFVPPTDFLKKTIPFFYKDPQIGLVQTRWGHINRDNSLLTRVQSIGIDGHFVLEQSARCWNNLFMNFNGTAGVWSKKAIEAAGGWHSDTLTEDLDLSYRAQLQNYRIEYLLNVISPAEIPEKVMAFKNQQYRWAKGSIQTARKLLPQVYRSQTSLFKKIQATIHLTHYFIHPLMVILALTTLPLLLIKPFSIPYLITTFFFTAILFSMFAPSTQYVFSQVVSTKRWWRRVILIPALMCVGIGIAINNSRAVLEALLGIKSAFIRTPKSGSVSGKITASNYKLRRSRWYLLEIFMGLYCFWSFILYSYSGKFAIVPFLFINTLGFLYVGFNSWREQTATSKQKTAPGSNLLRPN